MQDAFNVILWTSVDICIMHDEPNNTLQLQVFCCLTGFTSDFLGRNNQTTRYLGFQAAVD